VLSPRAINETRVHISAIGRIHRESIPAFDHSAAELSTAAGRRGNSNYTTKTFPRSSNNETSLRWEVPVSNSSQDTRRLIPGADRGPHQFSTDIYFRATWPRYQSHTALEQTGCSGFATTAGPWGRANQFTFPLPNAGSDVSQYDLGFFVQDDWRGNRLHAEHGAGAIRY